MKKLLLPLLVMISANVSADDFIYKPTEKEIEAVKSGLTEDIDLYFSGKDSAFKYGEYLFVTAEQAQKEYDANEARADKKFKGKSLVVSGTVSKIQSGFDDEPFVVLKTKNMFQSPQAKFKKSEFDKVIDLNKGQKVKFACIGEGEIAGTPMFKNCVFINSVIENAKSDMLSKYDALIAGNVNQNEKMLNSVAFQFAILRYISNDFAQCKKIDESCLEKIMTAEKKKKLNSAEIKEKFKPLSDYLGITKSE